MSEHSDKDLRNLADLYVSAGFPSRLAWSVSPGEGEEATFEELRKEGYLSPSEAKDWHLTERGVEWILASLGPMSEHAQKSLQEFADMYVTAGFPSIKAWSIQPGEGEEGAFGELRARGHLEQASITDWHLTDRGLAWVVSSLGDMSEHAQKTLRQLADQYVGAGKPSRQAWVCDPGDSEEATFGELRVRGYVEQATITDWRLTEAGVAWALEHVK